MLKFNQKIHKNFETELNNFHEYLSEYFIVDDVLVEVNIAESRDEFNKMIKKDTPLWWVGQATDKAIFVMSPEALEKESTHKKEEFIQLLKHEMCHIFIHSISPLCLTSMSEGTCLNFAGQDRTAKIKKANFDMFFGESLYYNLIPLKDFADLQGYQLGYMMVKNLLKNFNKKQIVELIKIGRQDQNWKAKIENITQMKFENYNALLKTNIEIK